MNFHLILNMWWIWWQYIHAVVISLSCTRWWSSDMNQIFISFYPNIDTALACLMHASLRLRGRLMLCFRTICHIKTGWLFSIRSTGSLAGLTRTGCRADLAIFDTKTHQQWSTFSPSREILMRLPSVGKLDRVSVHGEIRMWILYLVICRKLCMLNTFKAIFKGLYLFLVCLERLPGIKQYITKEEP